MLIQMQKDTLKQMRESTQHNTTQPSQAKPSLLPVCATRKFHPSFTAEKATGV